MSHSPLPPEQTALQAQFRQPLPGAVGDSPIHESAERHVSGEARYIDDRPEPEGLLHLCPRLSDHAHARILSMNVEPCYRVPGVVAVLTRRQIPGNPDIGALAPGDMLLAEDEVNYAGQIVLVVAAESREAARRGAQAAVIDYEVLTPILDVKEALEKQHYVERPFEHRRGDVDAALARAAHRLTGGFHVGGQEHFYLETQSALVCPGENQTVVVYASSQNPTEVQKLVASVLGVSQSRVTVEMRRMGGAFGGKESQGAGVACLCALAASVTGRPVKMCLSRRDDMRITGKRHGFFVRYEVGVDERGVFSGVKIDLAANCGHSLDLSGSIVDRAMFHADNAYYLGDALITGYRCRTHTVSNTAFRGFGGPQGMAAVEQVIEHIARTLHLDPLAVRKRNYYGITDRNVTHYYQPVRQNRLNDITERLEQSASYRQRRAEIGAFNSRHPTLRRGLALMPIKFGISFTASFLNQAGALLLVYTDGSVQLNHGGTEMGQGLNTKVAQIVAQVLQIDIASIQVTATHTGKVPNTSPTAASSGADLNGKAAQQAAEIIKQRLVELLCRLYACSPADVAFHNGVARAGNQHLTFAQVAHLAWVNQVPLSATGYYRVPGIQYDREAGRGEPFYYFVYGAACAEVVVDTSTGEYRVKRVDILHDAGASLNPALDLGQVEGGFVQGMGWVTTEELVWNEQGCLLTDTGATYKIPTVADIPHDFRVQLLPHADNAAETVFRSKAVGEPPFMLGMSVWCALQDAVAHRDGRPHRLLDLPATPERVWRALQAS
ncbi:xanthine dehydrogenase molybdopterin binding subunit [Lonsdalea populi]|uniref:xanthine dehydrogenase molybdopterin binding subunit n=1 Tax=Lonsdalea populi TaxID=1172565 RepID=UPI000A1EA73A|nr:xanthine dehydrogenase molybdopterin binding subunit [Lonsdalea populi]OSM95687.1 xanthine dehydrogenase molybdopterin binding subunit [Lonsdalea populi]QPQ23133.1 xanthine dehydrogenase molybdopterin binding subunit [Lonsdalea populi]RAT41680.1 xanthine dehydrogenase molybdopterin binding subunit [Lonsdalea populi]RAT42264.1 xanthine dehydrogenase molybdopterin binding subunit [Lonsdalea populi]RAT56631.1 xanthine dehydrogenase molybdopterin binding subunit [Lonsdalea populi]